MGIGLDLQSAAHERHVGCRSCAAAAPFPRGDEMRNERFVQLLDEMKALHEKKAADYGVEGDPLANLRGSADFGVDPWLGALIRFADKVQRLKSYAKTRKLANEGVADTLKDAAAYALLVLVLWEEAQNGKPQEQAAG